MALLKALMRIYSYLFHGLLTLFLLALSIVALSSGQELHLDVLPWQGRQLSYLVLAAALAGLLCLVLALRRTWRGLFFLWSLAVLVIMVRGFFFSSHYFGSGQDFHQALYLIAGAFVALCGAWFQARVQLKKR